MTEQDPQADDATVASATPAPGTGRARTVAPAAPAPGSGTAVTSAPAPGIGTAGTFAPAPGSGTAPTAAQTPTGGEQAEPTTTPRPGPAHQAAGRPRGSRLVPVVTALIGGSGVVLTAGALWGAHRMHGPARTLALVAAAVAAVAVLIALVVLLLKLVTAAMPDGGSRRPARRPWVTVAAGAILAGALVLTGTAVAVAVVGPTATDTPRLTVLTARAPDGSRSVRVDATVGGLKVGTPIAMSLTGLSPDADKPVLASAVQRANGDATSTVRLTALVPAQPDLPTVQVDVTVNGRLCQAVVPISSVVGPDAVTVTCRPV